jgi:hypothetical protein
VGDVSSLDASDQVLDRWPVEILAGSAFVGEKRDWAEVVTDRVLEAPVALGVGGLVDLVLGRHPDVGDRQHCQPPGSALRARCVRRCRRRCEPQSPTTARRSRRPLLPLDGDPIAKRPLADRLVQSQLRLGSVERVWQIDRAHRDRHARQHAGGELAVRAQAAFASARLDPLCRSLSASQGGPVDELPAAVYGPPGAGLVACWYSQRQPRTGGVGPQRPDSIEGILRCVDAEPDQASPGELELDAHHLAIGVVVRSPGLGPPQVALVLDLA